MFDDNSDTPARGRSLKHRLKSKSRRRREGAARLAAPSAAPRVLRNDILPTLELVCLPLQDLRSAKRQVRKIDPVHVREVAATMAALGFCVPVLGKNRHPSGRLARPDPYRRTRVLRREGRVEGRLIPRDIETKFGARIQDLASVSFREAIEAAGATSFHRYEERRRGPARAIAGLDAVVASCAGDGLM